MNGMNATLPAALTGCAATQHAVVELVGIIAHGLSLIETKRGVDWRLLTTRW